MIEIGEKIENITADMGNKTKTLVTKSKDKVTEVVIGADLEKEA